MMTASSEHPEAAFTSIMMLIRLADLLRGENIKGKGQITWGITNYDVVGHMAG